MGLWAGIKYALNSTLGTDGFIPLDKIIVSSAAKGIVTLEPGTYVLAIPVTAKGIHVIRACAGGGGGSFRTGNYGGAGGGGGGYITDTEYLFDKPNTDYTKAITITVGAGGTGGTQYNDVGGDGGATIIGDFATLTGGGGGLVNEPHAGAAGVPNAGAGGKYNTAGGDSTVATGGAKGSSAIGSSYSSNNQIGGGGGASLGNGGSGGAYKPSSNTSTWSGQPGYNYGGGGGGNNGYGSGSGGYTGGSGANGILEFYWLF